MQVLEKTIPWWRKALKFALGGIRSGFGIFPRPARFAPIAAPMFSGGFKEIPEEERALTKAFPKIEMAAPAIPASRGAEHGLVAAPESVPDRVKGKAGARREISEETSSGAKAQVDSVGVTRGLKPPPPSGSGFSAARGAEKAREAEVAIEAKVEPEPAAVPLSAAVSQTVTEAEPVVEPETNETPEVADVTPSEPFKEPESATDAELEAETEAEASAVPVRVPDVEQAAPADEQEAATASEPISAPESTLEISPEKEPVDIPVSETVAEPESAPEPVVEQTAASDEAPPLVLSAESSAEEKADTKADEKATAKLAARQKKLDEGSEESPFSVIVGQVYDGPLDLLLDLIRKQDIDIYDIPIATITSQFLAYVNQLKASDVDVAGEFIYTASLLIHIKSKMLLPHTATGPEDAGEDPRRELVERLLEHERFKNAAQMLQQKQMLEAATWTNPGVREFKDDEGVEPEIAADTVDLVRIFRDILERARNRPVIDVEEDSVTVSQMIQFLARRLTMEDKPVALRRLLSHTRSERALIAMFLALLEMVRLQAILLRQDRQFSEIFIKKHSGFDAVMNEGLGNARDDWR
ncbi:MAG: segregation/condensation protein A [Terracidiphilus sp.]